MAPPIAPIARELPNPLQLQSPVIAAFIEYAAAPTPAPIIAPQIIPARIGIPKSTSPLGSTYINGLFNFWGTGSTKNNTKVKIQHKLPCSSISNPPNSMLLLGISSR